MTGISRDDIRASVAAGILTEQQAASLMVLADERAGVRAQRTGLDEPFELFKGFNEIFIVVGLSILYAGWLGVTGLGLLGNEGRVPVGFLFSVTGMIGVAALARYFTLTRRMIAPSIALSIMFGLSVVQGGVALTGIFDLSAPAGIAVIGALATVLLSGYYYVFRVPFTVAQIALAVCALSFGVVSLGGNLPESPADMFLLTADGPFAVLTILLGLAGLAIAMRFDMSDPHRVTRRSRSGFWLHIIAAPAIVNTVALSLFSAGTFLSQVVLIGFVLLMAILAIIIDRRSFLVSGVGYVVALAFTVIEGEAFLAILALGVVLIVLGAQWEAIRRSIMTRLPAFPGKTRLPPYHPVPDEGST